MTYLIIISSIILLNFSDILSYNNDVLHLEDTLLEEVDTRVVGIEGTNYLKGLVIISFYGPDSAKVVNCFKGVEVDGEGQIKVCKKYLKKFGIDYKIKNFSQEYYSVIVKTKPGQSVINAMIDIHRKSKLLVVVSPYYITN